MARCFSGLFGLARALLGGVSCRITAGALRRSAPLLICLSSIFSFPSLFLAACPAT
jgi:hypothetical protein